MARILGGGELSAAIRVGALRESGVQPKLAVVTATDDESTAWYVRSIAKAATRTGIECQIVDLGATAVQNDVLSALVGLSANPDVHGIILQTPLPEGVDVTSLRTAITPDKDVDVGTTATDDGSLLGDVDAASVEGRAGGLTPVPGGVSPVTTALLLANTVTAATALSTTTHRDVGVPVGAVAR